MRAGEISSRDGDIQALRYLENLDEALRGDRRLQSAIRIYTHNAAAEVHNRFVELFQAEEYARAGEILEEGLADLPGNTMLSQDVEPLRKVRNQTAR
jgi:hypothetical protein